MFVVCDQITALNLQISSLIPDTTVSSQLCTEKVLETFENGGGYTRHVGGLFNRRGDHFEYGGDHFQNGVVHYFNVLCRH